MFADNVRNRIPHILKVRNTMDTPTNLLFFDTETRPEIDPKDKSRSCHWLFLGVSYALEYRQGQRSRERWNEFETTNEFWEQTKQRLQIGKPLHVFTHNLGFDLTIVDFWRVSEHKGWEVKWFVLEDPPTIIRASFKGKDIIFIDTLNYWRTSLRELGKAIGIEKGNMPNNYKYKDQWNEYCKQDVKIIAESVLSLFDTLRNNNLGAFGLSAPSIAMNSYKYRFMKPHEIFIHDNLKALTLERQSYYGGLVQNYYIGEVKKRVFKLDVNSLYPAMMLNKFPYKLMAVDDNTPLDSCKNLLKKWGCCAKVLIEDNHNTYPIKLDDKLLYVCGTYETYLCGPEFQRALAAKSIKRVIRSSWYALDYLFVKYIKHYWKMRQEYPKKEYPVQNSLFKLLMNSLYGKFGQKGFDWVKLNHHNLQLYYDKLRIPFPAPYEDTPPRLSLPYGSGRQVLLGMNIPTNFRILNNVQQFQMPVQEHPESFPGIAAFVTSYARERLLQLCNIAGKDHTFYTDTDSLFVDEIGFNNLKRAREINDDLLGKLKIEDVQPGAIFTGPKDYTYNGYHTIKGIRGDAIKISNSEYIQNRFEGIRSVLARLPLPYITIDWVLKQRTERYSKGSRSNTGWTKPFKLGEKDFTPLFG